MTDLPDTRLTRRGVFRLMGGAITAAAAAPLLERRADAPVAVAEPTQPEPIEHRSAPIVHSRPAKLETFLKSRGIRPAELARDSGYSRTYLLRVRMGRQEASGAFIVHITRSCRRLAREHVMPHDLFVLSRADVRAVMRLFARIEREERWMHEG